MLKALDGYPAPGAVSVKNQWAGDYFGPASYAQPGEVIPASAFAMSAIEFATVSAQSQSGTYTVRFNFPATSGPTEGRAPAFSSLTAEWIVAATGVQVSNGVNLSGEVVRASVVGL